MKTPESLETLVDYGIIQEVVRPLMSGKEAHVYVVVSGGVEYVAKVYKEANQRTFKHRVEYTEGRRTRNTRDQRAINKRSRHGRKQDEAAWRNAEVDTIYRLQAGGVRVPEPINFVDGVLVMELVRDAEGHPAPRLGDLEFNATKAVEIYQKLIREVIRMLCAGVVHGDLSEFNVLMGADGPVVIDFPQSVDPAKNQSARKLLLRDVENLHRFLSRHSPTQAIKPLAEEIWSLYEKNRLDPDTELAGSYVAPKGDTNMDEVLALIEDANLDEQMRREARGDETPVVAPPPLRRVVDFTKESSSRPSAEKPRGRARPIDSGRPRNRTRKKPSEVPTPPRAPTAHASTTEAAATPPSKRRSRRPRGNGRVNKVGTSPAGQNSAAPGDGTRPTNSLDRGRPPKSESVGPDERNRPQKRRRRRRPPARSDAEEKRAGPSSATRRPVAPAIQASSEKGPTSKGNEAGPALRRRRRRRSAPDTRSS